MVSENKIRGLYEDYINGDLTSEAIQQRKYRARIKGKEKYYHELSMVQSLISYNKKGKDGT